VFTPDILGGGVKAEKALTVSMPPGVGPAVPWLPPALYTKSAAINIKHDRNRIFLFIKTSKKYTGKEFPLL
jgi:hypothetical protein